MSTTPGFSRNEIFRARHIYRRLRIYCLEKVCIDDARNLILIRSGRGRGPTVALAAHPDVAIRPREQPVGAVERGGRVYGASLTCAGVHGRDFGRR